MIVMLKSYRHVIILGVDKIDMTRRDETRGKGVKCRFRGMLFAGTYGLYGIYV